MRNGLFTHFLLEGMRQGAVDPDGAVRILKLCSYISRQVPEHQADQHPLMKSAAGEFILSWPSSDIAPPSLSLRQPSDEGIAVEQEPSHLAVPEQTPIDKPKHELVEQDLPLLLRPTRSSLQSISKRLIVLLLNRKRRLDYLIAAGFAALPILTAALIGAGKTVSGYKGYFVSYNWLAFVVIFPLVLYLLRLVMFQLLGTVIVEGVHDPPVIELTKGYKTETESIRSDFRDSVLDVRALYVAIFIAVAFFFALDLKEVLGVYVDYLILDKPSPLREKDWGVIFVEESSNVSPWANLVLVFIAQLVQTAAVTLAFLAVGLLFTHNLYFLQHIFQRRFSGNTASPRDIVVQLDDQDQCFGFRRAYRAFNTQVLCLTATGVILLISRFMNVDASQSKEIYGAIDAIIGLIPFNSALFSDVTRTGEGNPLNLFPDVGQVILAIAWIIGFLVISMPALVKLLPLFTSRRIEWQIDAYLKELLPDESLDWADLSAPTLQEVDNIAQRFTRNAFWPSGDNRGKILFLFSFYVFLVILFPLHFDSHHGLKFVSFYIFLIFLAFLMTGGFLKLFNIPLNYIDSRLTKKIK